MSTAGAALATKGVSKSFGNVHAVTDVSLEAASGGAYGLIGPNGAGKSTFFDLISGVQAPDRGSVSLDGDDVTGWPAEDLAARGLLRTFQHTSVFPGLTVEQNLMVGGYLIDGRRPLDALLRRRGYHRALEALRDRAVEVLDLLEMSTRASMVAENLSYGELRYLEVAIALMSYPRLLLLDEPAAGLSSAEASRLKDIIDLLIGDPGVTTIVVEHNVALVTQVSETLWVLHHGELIAAGPPQEVTENSRVREVYLGG